MLAYRKSSFIPVPLRHAPLQVHAYLAEPWGTFAETAAGPAYITNEPGALHSLADRLNSVAELSQFPPDGWATMPLERYARGRLLPEDFLPIWPNTRQGGPDSSQATRSRRICYLVGVCRARASAIGPDTRSGSLKKMITDSLMVSPESFTARTGWALKPEGACKGQICVSLGNDFSAKESIDIQPIADRLGMGVVHDATHGLWAIGPETLGGHALATAEAPNLTLPNLDGEMFELASLRGQKVLLVAWSPY